MFPIDLKVGDYLKFPSGRVRRIITIRPGKYVQFIQVADGVIGNYRSIHSQPHWRKKTHADGKRLTTYTWSDLKRIFR
jgi:hypothetical protein